MKTVYDFDDYKEFISFTLDQFGKGSRSQLAHAVGCQPGFVTHVLKGHAHFSQEQAIAFCEFAGLDRDGTSFLLLLLNLNRASSNPLRKFLQIERDKLVDAHETVHKRLNPSGEKSNFLSADNQSIFYSSWIYMAIHAAISIPGLDTEQSIASRFGLPIKKVREVLDFLTRTGLLNRENSKLVPGVTQTYLNGDSYLISRFHSMWRTKAIGSLDNPGGSDMHYSSVVSCSVKDAKLIREVLIEALERVRGIVKKSKDETIFSYGMDLFEL
jgi:uncharacterized protein (TIGR02147 family)